LTLAPSATRVFGVIEVYRGGGRFATSAEGLVSRHSFSFGVHYDPGNVGFASLVAHNDDLVAPGHGYDTHPHSDLEIVTWVLEGSLVHEDSHGHGGVLTPGVVQRLSAGRGVLHSERNDAGHGPTRFVQMWLRPDEPGADPSFDRAAAPVSSGSPGLVTLASGIRGLDAAVGIGVAGAALHLARLDAGAAVGLPDAERLHVFTARGTVVLEGAGRLQEGDAARLAAEGGPRLTASAAAEVLVWQLPPG
jgi:redox-sensitive bicupin YhaK (pirin superfamily)